MTDQSKPTTDMPDVIYADHGDWYDAPRHKNCRKYIRADLVPAAPTGDKAAAFCEDEGCEHYGTKHYCNIITKTRSFGHKSVKELIDDKLEGRNTCEDETFVFSYKEMIELKYAALQENTAPDDLELIQLIDRSMQLFEQHKDLLPLEVRLFTNYAHKKLAAHKNKQETP